jgi:flagellar basal-body rod modification protein FlgD
LTLEEILGTTSPEPQATEAQASGLGREDFLRMLIAQLENQDPLNPQDATEFTAQLATFSSLEQLIAMRSGIEKLVEASLGLSDPAPGSDPDVAQSLESANLIGRDVVAVGSQFQLGSDPDEHPARLRFELGSNTSQTVLRVLDANGQPVATRDLGPLAQGPQLFAWDGTDDLGNRRGPGVYSYQVEASHFGDAVDVAPLVEGRVTGVLVGEQPSLLLGDVVVPVANLVEVRSAETGS